jgi:hypothetical protein
MKHPCLSEDFVVINDNTKRFAMGLYAKCNGGERELARGETERECVCVRGRAYEKEGSSIGTKIIILHKHREEMQSNKKDKLCR